MSRPSRTRSSRSVQKTYNSLGPGDQADRRPDRLRRSHPERRLRDVVRGPTPTPSGSPTVGANGFSFIDKFGGVQSEADLATAIGHNLAHELMHAFGIANHPEQTGPYVDAAIHQPGEPRSTPAPDSAPRPPSLLSTPRLFRPSARSVEAAGAQKIDGDQVLVNDVGLGRARSLPPWPSGWSSGGVGLRPVLAFRGDDQVNSARNLTP